MRKTNYVLLILLIVGFLARSNHIATAACILLVFRLTNLQWLFPTLEKRGLELGLIFLMLSILVPLSNGNLSYMEIAKKVVSPHGLIALAGGALATHMNGEGLKLLKLNPQLIFGMVLGSIIGIVFLGGVPIGPLMAAGLTALFLEVVHRFKY